MRKQIPHNYTPRHYQLGVLDALDSGVKRAVCIWHRRAGKDKTFLNFTIKNMIERVGIYYYLFPTYAQGKKIIWDGIDKEGFKFLDHFPEEAIESKNNTEMKIIFKNNSLFQIVGTDNYDAIMGTNPVGCVFSEYSLQDPTAWGYIRPILRENNGWAIFPYTPRGFNHGYDLYQMAQNDKDWYCELLTVRDTGALTEEDVDAERRSGMSEPMIQQEYYCSFEHHEGMAFRDINKEIHMINVNNPPERLLEIFDFDKMTPRSSEINIFRSMDWGFARPFSVGWYFTDYEGRLYKYRELYGCKSPNEGIQLPARDVAMKIREIETEHGETVSLSIADASIWDKPSNQNEKAEKMPSIAETMDEEGVYFDREISIDAKKSRLQGKHQMHERLRVDNDGLPNFFVFSNCVHWWRTVPNLPCDSLNPEDVDTKAEDHCLHGDTEVITKSGSKNIQDLVGTTGYVLSIDNTWVRYSNCRKTRINTPILKITYKDGREVKCTPDHKFLTLNGWVEAKDLLDETSYDIISVCQLKLLAEQYRNFREQDITYVDAISVEKVKRYTGLYGKITIKEAFRRGIISTIKTVTGQITALRILNLSLLETICHYMANKMIFQTGLNQCTLGLTNGMAVQLVENGIRNNTKNTVKIKYTGELQKIAYNAIKNIRGYRFKNSATQTAKQNILEQTKIIKVEDAGCSDVYCLTADNLHCFAVNDGIIVQNCYDETRYILSARPFQSSHRPAEIPYMSVEGVWRRHGSRSPYRELHRGA